MQPSFPWLCQGDLFTSVPVVTHARNEHGVHTFLPNYGTAVLLTEDCQLDKPHSVGSPVKISYLQFAPVTSLTACTIPNAILGQIKTGGRYIDPPALVYINDVGDGTDGLVDLGQAYPLDATYFAAVIRDFAGHPAITDDKTLRAVATANGTRSLTMTPEERAVLHAKQMAYWTYIRPKQ